MTDQSTVLNAVGPAGGTLEAILRVNFLNASIQNTQAIIQATDVKLNILIAILLLPLTRMDQVVSYLSQHRPVSGLGLAVVVAIAVLLAGAWLLALFTTLRGLVAIRDAAAHIRGQRPPQVKGCFYNADLFPHTRFRGVGDSIRTIDEQVRGFPNDLDSLLKELAWEQMKLTYIREVKMRRQRLAYGAAMASVLLALLLWPISVWLL